MDFNFNADQLAISDLAQQIFAKQASDDILLEQQRKNTEEYSANCHENLWLTLAQQGLLGLAIPENFGGSGLSFSELCLLLVEQGKRVAPVPLFSSLVLGALPIAHFGSEKQRAKYLPAIASGELKLSAALAHFAMRADLSQEISARRDQENWILNGEALAVPDGVLADAVLIPARDEKNQLLFFIVEKQQPGVNVQSQQNSLGSAVANIVLHQVQLTSAALLADASIGNTLLQWLMQRADTALCALQLGVCEAALQRTAVFTSERKQFAMPLASFQAVAMRAADAYIDIEAMRSLFWQAMWRLDSGLDAAKEVQAAKWWACQGGHRVAHAVQHLHGGIGADIEYPIQRFFLWAKQIAFMLGNASTHITLLGELLAADQ